MNNSPQILAQITKPTTDTITALDPDIAPSHQRVRFMAKGHKLRWVMDGKLFAKWPHHPLATVTRPACGANHQ